jgi:trypsin
MKLSLAIVLAVIAIASAAVIPETKDARIPLPYPKALEDLWQKVKSEDDSERIVGGTAVPSGGRPFQVVLLRNNGFVCGGSLINAQTVLTAAHCIDGVENSGTTSVRYNTLTYASGGSVIACTRLVKHASYSSSTIDYDYATCHLASAWAAGTNAAAVVLATAEPSAGENLIVSGWGKLSGTGSVSATLQQVTLAYITNAACQQQYNGINTVSARMVCGYTAGKSACNGDSGGPLTRADGTQIGIVSWGMSSCSGYPTVFAHVVNQRTWILNNSA